MDEIQRLIPHRPPFLFIDQVIEVNENGAKTGLNISHEMPFFQGHYQVIQSCQGFYSVNRFSKLERFFIKTRNWRRKSKR